MIRIFGFLWAISCIILGLAQSSSNVLIFLVLVGITLYLIMRWKNLIEAKERYGAKGLIQWLIWIPIGQAITASILFYIGYGISSLFN